MFRRARLLSDVLDDKPQAIEVYQVILDLGLERQALDALETLYTGAGRWADLIALYERQLDARLGSAADLHVSIGRVAARNQGEIARAFEQLEEALKLDRQHTGAIAELERLLLEAPELEQRAHAAALLEPVYLARADYTRVMDTIRARLEYAPGLDERRELLTRLAQLYEEQKEDYRAAPQRSRPSRGSCTRTSATSPRFTSSNAWPRWRAPRTGSRTSTPRSSARSTPTTRTARRWRAVPGSCSTRSASPTARSAGRCSSRSTRS
jgi:tetratricopeptide (TPR) repeat protein